MGGRRLALALGAALGLVALLVAWLADARGAREVSSAAAEPVRDRELAPPPVLRDAAEVPLEPERTPVEAGPPSDAALALEPRRGEPVELGPREGLLQVRVVALETKEPLAGASVRLESPDGVSFALAASERARGTWTESLVTDGEGRVDFRVPSGEPLVLHARFELEPGRSARLPVRPIEPGQYRTAILGVFVEPDRTWCARVVDGATGLPIAGARLTPAGGGFASSVFQAWSGADGGLCLALSTGVGSLVVASEGYGPVVVEPGRHDSPAEAQVIELLRTASLEVLVRAIDGDPVAGARVAAWPVREDSGAGAAFGEPWSETTDADGRAVLAGLLAGAPLVAAVSAERLAHVEALVLAPGERRAVLWRLAEPGVVSGFLRDARGSPVPGAALSMVPLHPGMRWIPAGVPGEIARRTTTDAEGRFLLRDVPAGPWRIGEPVRELAFAGRFPAEDGVVYGGIPVPRRADEARAAFAIESRDVVLVAGESAELDLRAWRGLTIRGKLAGGDVGSFLDPRFENVFASAGIAVHAESPAYSAASVSSTSGEFVIGPLVPGEYLLTTRFPNGKTGQARASAGATDVEIREIW